MVMLKTQPILPNDTQKSRKTSILKKNKSFFIRWQRKLEMGLFSNKKKFDV